MQPRIQNHLQGGGLLVKLLNFADSLSQFSVSFLEISKILAETDWFYSDKACDQQSRLLANFRRPFLLPNGRSADTAVVFVRPIHQKIRNSNTGACQVLLDSFQQRIPKYPDDFGTNHGKRTTQWWPFRGLREMYLL